MILANKKVIPFLVSIFFSLITLTGQTPKKTYVNLNPYFKGTLAFKKGNWESARRFYLSALEKCNSKDSIDIIKNEIINCNVILEYSKKANVAFLIGNRRAGITFLEKIHKINPENKTIRMRLFSFWNKKRKQAIRQKSYQIATNYLNYIQGFDSLFFKKNKVKIKAQIENDKKRISKKILKYLNLNITDSISVEHRLEDSLKKINLKFSKRELKDSLKTKDNFIHLGIITGVNYALPEFKMLGGSFDRIYFQPTRFMGFKLTLGKLTSHFSVSAEYRFIQYKFNTYFYSTYRKITLEDFNIETTDIPIYINYQIKPVYGSNLFLISLGGVIHKTNTFSYQNYLENKSLSGLENINSSWYSGMIGLSFQKKIIKKLKLEVSVKYNKGFGDFLNIDKLNSIFKPSSFYQDKMNENPLVSSKMNSVNAGIALSFDYFNKQNT